MAKFVKSLRYGQVLTREIRNGFCRLSYFSPDSTLEKLTRFRKMVLYCKDFFKQPT